MSEEEISGDDNIMMSEEEEKMQDDENNNATPSDSQPSMEDSKEAEDKAPEYGGHVTRLMIKRIRLHNFKSYAGIKDIGPFHHRFSAIVGPNGSGKSNLIDALLFVFGYRTKKLRLNKLSELIHNSNHGSDLPFASVEIQFQQVIDIVSDSRRYFHRMAYVNDI